MIDHNCLYYREKDEFGPEYCGKLFIGFGDRLKCENRLFRKRDDAQTKKECKLPKDGKP